MIRNSRGIQIRRNITQQLHAPRTKLLTCFKDTHARRKLLDPSHLQNFEYLWKCRLYHASFSMYSSDSTVEQEDITHIPTLNNTSDVVVGHDYVEAPDSGPIISNMSVNEINNYLTERLRCLVNRNSQQLRNIDESLEIANVFVDDITKQWRADGKRFAVYLRKENSSTALQNGLTTQRNNDYFRSPYSGPSMTFIAESEIHDLLSERHYHRRLRDFDSSDRVRKKLESYGVFIDDKKQKWRGDGTKISFQTHNYTMSRDSGPIKAGISEEEIQNMLNKRHRCQLRKDHKGADRIYEKLNNCGVSIDDELLEWRADGITFSKFIRRHEYKLASDAKPSIATVSDNEIHKLLARHWSYKQSGDTKKADDVWQDLYDIGVFLDFASLEWRADGLMHNYRPSSNAGRNVSKLNDKEIDTLLEKRMLLRWRKDFETSDHIRDSLKNDGVLIDDVNKEWRADGKLYHHLCHQYRQALDSGPSVSTLSDSAMHLALSELWQSKLARDFAKSDAISDELFKAGVYFNDKKQIWRADGKTCNFEQIPGSGPLNNNIGIDESQIHRMLEESFRFRLRQDFVPANHIHDQLFNAGTFLELDSNLYRVDGIMHNYVLSSVAGQNTSLMSDDIIHKLLAERWHFKITQQFGDADRIFVELRDNGVCVDDESMEWRADGVYHTYRLTSNAGPIISTLPLDEIHTLIGRRVRHKKFKDFVKADQIMRYLKGAKVHLEDKKKEWRADGITYNTTNNPIKERTSIRRSRS